MTDYINELMMVRPVELGIQQCILNLGNIYRNKQQLMAFDSRWEEFFAASAANKEVFGRKRNSLSFYTESLVPSKIDSRPALLLIFGNPAPESVLSKICFAQESNGHEHRFWIALRDTGLLNFHSDSMDVHLPITDRNKIRKQEIFNLEYHSAFRVGIAVYYSMPSPASHPKWSGVNGLRRLFGRTALAIIENQEQHRLQGLTRIFLQNTGSIIAFQRDAYQGVRSSTSPIYSLEGANSGTLQGVCRWGQNIRVVGFLPTRYAHSRLFKARLTSELAHLLTRRCQFLKK